MTFKIELNGNFTAVELKKKLSNLLNLISSEDASFSIDFKLEEIEKIIDNSLEVKYRKGYQVLQSNVEGLHNPNSEYEQRTSDDFTGIVEKNGTNHYQTFYICSRGHKGKQYLKVGTVYCNCKECGERMKMREAVKGERLKADEFKNYFIAGKFKRADEIDETKLLHELFGATE